MALVPFWRGFGGINLRNEVKKITEHTFQNRHFWPPKKTRIWTRTNWEKVRRFGRELGIRNNTTYWFTVSQPYCTVHVQSTFHTNWKSCIMRLLISELHPTSHHFWGIAEYWSNFCHPQERCLCLMHLFWVNPKENLPNRYSAHCAMLKACDACTNMGHCTDSEDFPTLNPGLQNFAPRNQTSWHYYSEQRSRL